jgi:hypothetical protein
MHSSTNIDVDYVTIICHFRPDECLLIFPKLSLSHDLLVPGSQLFLDIDVVLFNITMVSLNLGLNLPIIDDFRFKLLVHLSDMVREKLLKASDSIPPNLSAIICLRNVCEIDILQHRLLDLSSQRVTLDMNFRLSVLHDWARKPGSSV